MTKRLDEAVAVLQEMPDEVQDAAAEALLGCISVYAQIETDAARRHSGVDY